MSYFMRIFAIKSCDITSKLLKGRTNTIRCMSREVQNKIHQEKEKLSSTGSWSRIYYFPHIRIAAVLNRFKLYQTAFTLAAVPFSVVMYINGLMELLGIQVVSGCAVAACGTLYLITSFFRKLVGIISISEDQKLVKISHLTFWGRKKDLIVPLEDIVPLTDGSCNPTEVYTKLLRYSTEDFLYFTLKFGKILDKSKFELVFGNMEVFGLKK
ncbi:transmembrane protein 186 [Nephila pilipes]|uniref:Transmembrane protein 186 n=1 Tax=Nephila pilipes TaxID=299642 RepID=A0A8X6NNU3_NEPPI|nr:transmembrane protein 186 [Nephila pilipes]